MISVSHNNILSSEEIELMNGNDTYMTMVRNKLKISDFKIEDPITEKLIDPLNYTEGLVYYSMENVYGHGTLTILFENALDMENYRINVTTQFGLDQIAE